MAIKRQTLSLVFILALVTGCTTVPVGKYAALKSASEAVLANTTDTFTRIERMQAHFRIVVAPNENITTTSFDPPTGTDIVPELRFREDALGVLVKYTDVLDALASKDYMADVDKASIELAGSLGQLATTSKALPEDKANVVGGIAATLVDVIGREIVREKRINALKNVMEQSQKHIETLANLIAGDNEKIARDVDVMLDRVIAHANADRPAFGTAGRISFDESIAQQIFEARAVKESLASMSTAVKQIPKAHREIRDTLAKKSSGIEGLKSLVQEAQRANKFYRDLKQQ